MLRILFSRAAVFPWLGLALMGAGAAFPDGNVVGIVLVVIGANVAFYSLKDFSQKFEWGTDSRSMLVLCGLSFVAGLGLLLGATEIDHSTRQIALVSAGLYLGLFAVWVVQIPVGPVLWIASIAGVLLMILGGIFGYLGWREWRVIAETEPTPQEITLADLQQNGFGTNRFVRLTDFRFCERSVAEKREGKASFDILWFPLVATGADGVKQDGPAPSVPSRVRVVAGYVGIGEPEPGKRPIGTQRVADSLRKKKEAEGYECTVVTGRKKLKSEVQAQLAELAPETDFSDILILDWGTPRSAERVRDTLLGGGVAFFVGFLVLLFVYLRAWQAVRSWTADAPSTDDRSSEDDTSP
jgi:hypothetical protein